MDSGRDNFEFLLDQYLSAPTERHKELLYDVVVHQGWRFENSVIAAREIITKAECDENFRINSIDLLLSLCTGDLVQLFPHTSFYAKYSPSRAKSMEYCEPREIAEKLCHMAIRFAPEVAVSFATSSSIPGRIASLQFLYCFHPRREVVLSGVKTLFESPNMLENLAAICISSLMGFPVRITKVQNPASMYEISFEFGALVLEGYTLSALDVPIMNWAWEVALIEGATKSGSEGNLLDMVSLLDDWRQDEFMAALQKFRQLAS